MAAWPDDVCKIREALWRVINERRHAAGRGHHSNDIAVRLSIMRRISPGFRMDFGLVGGSMHCLSLAIARTIFNFGYVS